MAEKRKLQCDIDKCVKKINEGVEDFENIWQKLQIAPTNNQKEKYETDLKKEIKKLQRLRELLKTFLTSNDVKDKAQLLESRRLIENQMEKYKIIEKDSKHKNQNKDNNASTPNKFDFSIKPKDECLEWIISIKNLLNQKKKQLEKEIESPTNSSKAKKKTERNDSLYKINKIKKHLSSLQVIQLMLEQGSLDYDEVNCIKKDLEYYADHCQDPSFVENDSIYDNLGLDFDCINDDSANNSFSSSSSIAIVSPSVNNNQTKVAKSNKQNNLQNPTLNNSKLNAQSTSYNNNGNISAINQSTISNAKHLGVNSTVSSMQNANNASLVCTDSLNAQNMSDSNENREESKSLTQVISSTVISLKTNSTFKNNNLQPFHSPNKSKNIANAPILSYSSAVNNSSTISNENNIIYSVRSNLINKEDFPFKQDVSSYANVNKDRSSKFKFNDSKGTQTLNKSFIYPNEAKSLINETESWSNVVRSVSNQNENYISNNNQSNVNLNNSSKLNQSKSYSNQKKIEALVPLVCNGPNKINCSSLKKETVPTKNTIWFGKKTKDCESFAQWLSFSLKKIETDHFSSDKNGRRISLLKPFNGLHHIHNQPMSWCFDNLSYYSNFSSETLFFIFYYFEGTRSQYLAAKTLKSKKWRFHTMLLTWFMRYDDPKVITEDYEQGNYLCFDYEKWVIAKNDNFVFEYQYLDDKDL